MSHEEAPRRTGTVPRGPLRRQRPPADPRAGWVLVVAALVVGTVAVAWMLGATGTRGTATASPTREALATSSPVPASPTLPESTLRPSAPPSPAPTDVRTPQPTNVITAEPTVQPSPESTAAPRVGLVIDFPADGEVIRSRLINVVGTAPPGSTITRDIPLWFDAHTTTRADGIWMLPVELIEGENALTFRIGDDRSTEIRLTVTYRPGR